MSQANLPSPGNLAFVEALFEDYLRNAGSVPPDWQQYFAETANGELRFEKQRFGPSFRPRSIFNPPTARRESARPTSPAGTAPWQDRVYLLIRLYRVRGHRIAHVDPLGQPHPVPAELEPEFFGFTEADMDVPVYSETFQSD